MSRRNWPAILPSKGKHLEQDVAALAFAIEDLRSQVADLSLPGTTVIVKRKASSTLRNNTAVLADDPHLAFGVGPNELWIVHLFLGVSGPTAADIRIGFSVPTGSSY